MSLEGFCVSDALVERDADLKTRAEKDANTKGVNMSGSCWLPFSRIQSASFA